MRFCAYRKDGTGWKNDKHASQWRNTLAAYAYPTIGNILVRDVALPHVLEILNPLWTTKTETATRLRGRIEKVLDFAKSNGYRTGDNPAGWRGHLDNLLPKPGKVAKADNHAALPYIEIGAFMADLRQQAGMGARALEFAILTAARSGEVRGATWDEIDFEKCLWTVPAERMKAGKEHFVPCLMPPSSCSAPCPALMAAIFYSRTPKARSSAI